MLSTVIQVNRGSTFALRRSPLDCCLGGQRSCSAAQRSKRTEVSPTRAIKIYALTQPGPGARNAGEDIKEAARGSGCTIPRMSPALAARTQYPSRSAYSVPARIDPRVKTSLYQGVLDYYQGFVKEYHGACRTHPVSIGALPHTVPEQVGVLRPCPKGLLF